MVSVLNSRSSGPGLIPGRGHCVVLLGKSIECHGVHLHPGLETGTGEFNAGGIPVIDQHPIQGGVEVYFLVAPCYRNWDKLWH